MFSPTRNQARELFFLAWEKYCAGKVLEGLETTALEVILLHPEYHALLGQRERNIDRDYLPESGQINPFLHLSLHLSVAEQLAINQPAGICALYEALLAQRGDRHAALHVILECLGETVWQANRLKTTPDQDAYLSCVRDGLNQEA